MRSVDGDLSDAFAFLVKDIFEVLDFFPVHSFRGLIKDGLKEIAVGFAIGFYFEDANTGGHSFEGKFEAGPIGDVLVFEIVSLTEVGDGDLLRGGEVLFVGRLVFGDGEEFKDAAAGIVEEDDGEAPLQGLGEQEGGVIVKEGEVAAQEDGGGALMGDPDGGGEVAVYTVDAAIPEEGSANFTGAPEPFCESYTEAVGKEDGGFAGEGFGKEPGDFAAKEGFAGT